MPRIPSRRMVAVVLAITLLTPAPVAAAGPMLRPLDTTADAAELPAVALDPLLAPDGAFRGGGTARALAAHTYGTAGELAILIVVSDDDGGRARSGIAVIVTPAVTPEAETPPETSDPTSEPATETSPEPG